MSSAVISVSQLNKYVHSLIDGDLNLKSVFISGEISNLKINSFSGHMYFTLKDDQAAVKAVMFKWSASRLKFLPQDGMKVICRCDVTVYEKDGVYQINIGDMQPDGAGSIAVAFEQLKAKLEAEGLFDSAKKRPLPQFPKKIAVITSDTGAAVKDMISVISRRWPIASILMCPTSVQGDTAAEKMCATLEKVNSTTDADVIIIGRGGGSTEDLWCFNDETLARAVSASKIPIVSAVGHETDFTICDFVADLRAPTPSAAAELVVPDIAAVYNTVLVFENRAKNAVAMQIKVKESKLNDLLGRPVLKDKQSYTDTLFLRLDSLYSKLLSAFDKKLSFASETLAVNISKLDALNPANILLRGFAIAEKDNKTIKSISQLSPGDSVNLKLSDGLAECLVKDIKGDNNGKNI